jgi:hypothetical protein
MENKLQKAIIKKLARMLANGQISIQDALKEAYNIGYTTCKKDALKAVRQ